MCELVLNNRRDLNLFSQGQSSEPPGDPVTFFSTGAGYVHATSDYGVLYTREFEWTPENNMVDVKHVCHLIFLRCR